MEKRGSPFFFPFLVFFNVALSTLSGAASTLNQGTPISAGACHAARSNSARHEARAAASAEGAHYSRAPTREEKACTETKPQRIGEAEDDHRPDGAPSHASCPLCAPFAMFHRAHETRTDPPRCAVSECLSVFWITRRTEREVHGYASGVVPYLYLA